MIDIENEVYTSIATRLREAFPKIDITGTYVHAPAAFPHVSITEDDNFIPTSRLDSSDQEKYASLMYKVDVYSNKRGDKKSEARRILALIDEQFYRMNFVRSSMNPVPNLEDASIYRLVARYRAVTDGKNVYRR